MINRLLQLLRWCALGCLVSSCTYNDEETLYPEVCDTTQVTYSGVIAPLIQTRCFECHDMTATVSGIPLEGYDNLKTMVDAGRLVGALRHQAGFSFMPKDQPSLPECEILKIEKWVSDGAPNN